MKQPRPDANRRGGRALSPLRQSATKNSSSEKGMALLVAILVAVLLTLIGLSLTRSAMTEYTMSSEFEAHERALIIADAAFNITKDGLRGRDLTTELSAATQIPAYLEYEQPQAGSSGERNPVDPYEARNIDFEHAPASIGTRTAYGFLTPATGVEMGSGRYFARLSDNKDEEPLGLTDNPRVDSDYTVFLRVLGVHRASVSEINSVGTAGKNSLAILEGVLRRDLSFDLASPLVLYGQDVDASFSGNSFDIVGDAQHPAVTVLNNDPAAGDASVAYNSMLSALGSKGNVVGAPGPDGVSLVDGTDAMRNSSNPDATNVFDPAFLNRFVSFLASVADNLYTQDTHLSGAGADLGSVNDPKITVALGDLTLTGGGSGAGVLIVKGSFELGGAFDYDGLVLVVGEGDLWLHGANKDLTGGVYVARIEQDPQGEYSFGTPSIRLSGNSNFVFDSDDLRMAINLLPMKTISLREITPDIEGAP